MPLCHCCRTVSRLWTLLHAACVIPGSGFSHVSTVSSRACTAPAAACQVCSSWLLGLTAFGAPGPRAGRPGLPCKALALLAATNCAARTERVAPVAAAATKVSCGAARSHEAPAYGSAYWLSAVGFKVVRYTEHWSEGLSLGAAAIKSRCRAAECHATPACQIGHCLTDTIATPGRELDWQPKTLSPSPSQFYPQATPPPPPPSEMHFLWPQIRLPSLLLQPDADTSTLPEVQRFQGERFLKCCNFDS